MAMKAVHRIFGLLSIALLVSIGSFLNAQEVDPTAGVAGIDIDAEGVLRVRQTDPALAALQRKAALQAKPKGSVKTSELRKVSLQRLEAALKESLESGQGIQADLATLAGMTRIEYVMYLPGSQDIVIAGPAEEVIQNPDGRLVGIVSGKPTLRLDDLAVALRAFGPTGGRTDFISCSIDPTAEGLAQMQAYWGQVQANFNRLSGLNEIASGLKNSMGLQTVSIHGIPASTRFAQTLVEADYRMKLIGIGLEVPAIALKSWVERSSPSRGSVNSLQRWYFTADYSAVKVSEDGSVLKLEGQGVKLVGEDERVDRAGNRSRSNQASSDSASKAFTKEFTEKFERLADVTPVFYDMRNLFDLSVAAAFIQEQRWYDLASWDLGVLGNEDEFQIEIAQTPRQVETAVNAIWRGNQLMAPLGGGINISARKLARKDATQVDETLAKKAALSAPKDLAPGQWWWD